MDKAQNPTVSISIGYPAEEKGPADRFIDANIHREKW